VCIDATGTYTVTLDAPVDSVTSVLAISVGGTGAVPTLTISGDKERVNVGEGVVIAAGATVLFNSGQGNTLSAVGTITNSGSLKVVAPCGGCGGATISADIINSGTIQIIGGPKLTLSKVNGQYQNTGNFTFGGTIDIPATAGNAVFSQENGLYTGAGSFDVLTMRSGIFQLKGGKIRQRFNTAPMIVLDGANLVIDSTATDSITIGVRGRTDAVPTITGNVLPLMTLWIGGAANGGMGQVALTGNPFNYGTMRVTRGIDQFGGITVIGSGRLTNVGTLNNTDANRDTLFYSIDLTNTGTINAIGQSSIVLLKPGGSYQNSGLIDLQAGISRLVVRSNSILSNTSPATITNGAVEIEGSQFIGTGTLATTLNVHDGGSVAPGFPLGLLTSNQLNVASTGIVNIDLGGNTPITQYDRWVATNLAGFSGTLNLTEVNGFRSGLCGQVFDVLYAPSAAAGMFPVINGLNPAPGRMLRPIMVSQTSTTPAIVRLVGFDPNLKVCAGPDSVNLTEGGSTLQYAVALRDAPTSTVIVKAVGDAQVNAPDSAVFTTSNWQTPQILHVSAVDDSVYEGMHVGHVTHTVRSLDAAYNGAAAGSITATITDNDLPPLVPTTVGVTIDSTSIEVGHTAQATAVVRDQNGNVMSGETVTWSSNTPSFASVSATGVITGVAAGTAVIKATDGSVSGTASVTVTAPPPPPPAVTTISVSIDSSSLQVGHTAQATATVRDQYGAVMSGQSVTWSSNTPSLASVSAAGVMTGIAEGSAVIKATIGSVFGTASVTVTAVPPPPPAVTTITVSIDSTSLQVGHTAQATATVRDQYGVVMSGQTVTWSSNTPSLASVSTSGVVSAIAEGSAVIKASIGAVSGTASLTITPIPPPPSIVTSVTVSIDSTSIQIGHTAQATAIVRDQNGAVMSGQTVVWTSLDPTFVSVSPSGVVTGLAGALAASIQASVGSVNGIATIAVSELSVPMILRVVIDSSSLEVGHTAQATAIVIDRNGAVMSGQPIVWTTSTPSFISVSSEGVITGIANGIAFVRATLGSLTATAGLEITGGSPASPDPLWVVIDLPDTIMTPGEIMQASARVYDQTIQLINDAPVEWRALDPSIISVSSTGTLTARKVGVAYVEGRSGLTKGIRRIHVLSQRPSVPKKILLVVPPLVLGDSAVITATVYDQFGQVMPSQPVKWEVFSNDGEILQLANAVCSASSCRLAKAIGEGWASIRASIGFLSDSKSVHIEFGAAKLFQATVSKSTKYRIDFWPGCSWDVWLENTQISSEWRNGQQGRGGAYTEAVRETVGGKCPALPWRTSLSFSMPPLSEGTEVELTGNFPQWYRARFRLTKVTRTGMTGILTIIFVDFGGRSFEISQSITLK